jgi:hypothetical protein
MTAVQEGDALQRMRDVKTVPIKVIEGEMKEGWVGCDEDDGVLR